MADFRSSHSPTVCALLLSTTLLATPALGADDQAPTGNSQASHGDIVVTATGSEQKLIDAPASISVVSREELEAQSYNDIVDAMRNVPGVYVTGGGNSQDITIRGMSAGYTLYLVDGRPVSAGRSVNTHGSDGGKQIGLPPLSMIERIEVIRGPMSSLYGSEAMGGVVNVITRKPTENWVGSVGAEYTHSMNDVSSDGQSANAYISGPIVRGLLGIKLNGAYTGNDESDYIGYRDGAESRPELKRRVGGAELVLTPDSANAITAGVQYAEQKAVHTLGKSIDASYGIDPNNEYEKTIYTLAHEGRYGDLSISSYLQHDISNKVQAKEKREKVTLLNTQASFLLHGRHRLTVGGQYKWENFVDESNGLYEADVPGAVAGAKRWIAAGFVEAEWRLRDDLTVTTGLRYNHDEKFGGHLTPRAYAVYHLTPRLTLKGGVSGGYKQPTLAQATGGMGLATGGPIGNVNPPLPHYRALQIGNPNLKPESSVSYEFGAIWHDPEARLNLGAIVFHTSYKDKISAERACSTPEPTSGAYRDVADQWACPFGGKNYYYLNVMQNIGRAIVQGVELSAEYGFTESLSISANYTFTHSEQRTGAFKGEPLNKMPEHMANVKFDWEATPSLAFWLQGNYRGRTSEYLSGTSMVEGTPGYQFFDLGAVYRLTDNARLKAGLYNIANKTVTNSDFGVVLDGRRMVVGINVDF